MKSGWISFWIIVKNVNPNRKLWIKKYFSAAMIGFTYQKKKNPNEDERVQTQCNERFFHSCQWQRQLFSHPAQPSQRFHSTQRIKYSRAWRWRYHYNEMNRIRHSQDEARATSLSTHNLFFTPEKPKFHSLTSREFWSGLTDQYVVTRNVFSESCKSSNSRKKWSVLLNKHWAIDNSLQLFPSGIISQFPRLFC